MTERTRAFTVGYFLGTVTLLMGIGIGLAW